MAISFEENMINKDLLKLIKKNALLINTARGTIIDEKALYEHIGEEKSSYLIVPEQFSHATERLLCKQLGNTVSLHTEVSSFRRLASKVKSEVGGVSATILGDGARILHLHSAIEDVMVYG